MAHSVPLSRSSRQPGLVEFNRWATIGALPAKCRQITDMKTATRWIFVLAVSVWSTAYSAGHIEWFGYPVKDSVYKFEVYTGETDRWDSAAQDTPPLSPGKASLAAKKFVRTVPLRDDMKEWGLRSITLRQMSSAPEEWLYLVHFDAVPKASVWNGPLPSIEIPVRFDDSVPKPTITGGEIDKDLTKQISDIVVDKSKFSEVYPAVGFSPATGEIVSLKERSERPPEEKTLPRIQMVNVPLADVIRTLARQSNLNYILDPHVPGSDFGPGRLAPKLSVTASWTNVTAQAALTALLKEHSLTMVTNPATTVTRIAPANLSVKPVPTSQVGTNTSSVIPLLVMDSVFLTEAVTQLASAASLAVSLDPKMSATAFDAQGTVSFRWERITARQALAALLDNYDLVMIEDPATSAARITQKSDPERKQP